MAEHETKHWHLKTEQERSVLVRQYMQKGQVRCFFCGRMFFPGTLGPGTNIDPKCPRCKKLNQIKVL